MMVFSLKRKVSVPRRATISSQQNDRCSINWKHNCICIPCSLKKCAPRVQDNLNEVNNCSLYMCTHERACSRVPMEKQNLGGKRAVMYMALLRKARLCRVFFKFWSTMRVANREFVHYYLPR